MTTARAEIESDAVTPNPQVRIVIVNYKTADLTIRCVRSIQSHGIATAAQITVVDNRSPDDSAARIAAALPDIQLIRSEENNGFGAGVNTGVAASTGELVLVLNPDTYFLRDSIREAAELAQEG